MYEKEIARNNDARLFDAATYWVSKGLMANIKQDSLEKVHDKFVEFKRLVMQGEFTINQIENDVYKKYGVMNTPEENVQNQNFMGALEGLAKAFEERRRRENNSAKKEKDKDD